MCKLPLKQSAQGLGGRVALMRAYREALEGSVAVHFEGNLINCMSCSNDMLYQASSSNLTRTSTDFWPNVNSSHGLHLWTNALVSLWFGQFVQPDWDMFQSGHAMGAYHAAARAVAGCPVYVSDKPDAHDFELLHKLVLPDGKVLRTQGIGLPTRDCLFDDPTKGTALLKIWNTNALGGVVGVFNARYGTGEVKVGSASDEIPSEANAVAQTEAQADENKGLADGSAPDEALAESEASSSSQATHTPSAPISGSISPSDISSLEGERFAVYAHYGREVRVLEADARWEITLPELQAEVFTVVPVESDFAPLGLTDMFNSGGAIQDFALVEDAAVVWLQSSGTFSAWSGRAPQRVIVAQEHNHDEGEDCEECESEVAFNYDAASQLLTVDLPREAQAVQVSIVFA
jgi:raffinose synthase